MARSARVEIVVGHVVYVLSVEMDIYVYHNAMCTSHI